MIHWKQEQLAEGVFLIEGDCLDQLKVWKVDHVITDPPYEDLMHEQHFITQLRRTDGGPLKKSLDFGGISSIRDIFLTRLKGKVNGWMLAFCNIEGAYPWSQALIKHKYKYRLTGIWHKPDATPKLNGQGPAQACEGITISWCGKGFSHWNGGGKRAHFVHPTNNTERTGLHPTEKPLSLMRELITLFTNPGDVVLDPFMGVGTTGVACIQLGRKFIGIELNEKYYKIAKSRIEKELRRPGLLIERPKLKRGNLYHG